MSSVADRIKQVVAKAKASGKTIKKPLVVSPSLPVRNDAKPQKHVPSVLTRKLPRVRRTEKSWSDYLANIQMVKRQAARLIAKALGEDWKISHQNEYHNLYFEHVDGLRLHFWPNKGRYEISLVDCHKRDSITVDSTRSAFSIARDIENRLLNKGAFDNWNEAQKRKKEERRKKVKDRLDMLEIVKQMGDFMMKHERDWNTFSSRPVSRRIGPVRVSQQYSGEYEFKIDDIEHEQAVELAKLLNDFFNLKRPTTKEKR